MEQLVADLQGLLSREAAEQPYEADLVGERQTVVVAAALVDLGQVGLGQGRFADHLSREKASGVMDGLNRRKTDVILVDIDYEMHDYYALYSRNKIAFPLFVARCMKTVAYLRISTGSQDLANQKLAVLDYARQKRFAIDRFVEAQASSRKGRDQRRIEELLGELAAGDRLVVSELSRLGRSLGQVIQLVDELVKRKVRFIAIKEAIRFEGKQDMQTKVMVALFGLFAEVERDLISERTKEGLAAARAKGRLLGRPKGSLGTSKLDGKEGEIRMLLEKEVSKASIAKIVGVSSTNLRHFIRTRKLDPKAPEIQVRGRHP